MVFFLLRWGRQPASQLANEFVTRPRAEKYVRGLGLTRVRSTGGKGYGREGERRGKTRLLGRIERNDEQRNGLAKLVPTLKPRNGLNDSWRVGGWWLRPFRSPFDPLVRRPPSPLFISPPLSCLPRPLSKEEEGSWQAARKEDPSFLPFGITLEWSFTKINSLNCARVRLLEISRFTLLSPGWLRGMAVIYGDSVISDVSYLAGFVILFYGRIKHWKLVLMKNARIYDPWHFLFNYYFILSYFNFVSAAGCGWALVVGATFCFHLNWLQ